MHTASSRCIYCAFHARQLALRSHRLNRPLHRASAHTAAALSGTRSFRPLGPPKDEDPNRFEGRRFKRGFKDNDDGSFSKISTSNGGRFVRVSSNLSFEANLKERLKEAKEDLKNVPLLDQLRKEAEVAGESPPDFEKIWKRFTQTITAGKDVAQPFFGSSASAKVNQEALKGIRDAWQQRGQGGMDDRIRYAFYAHLTGSRFSPTDIKNQRALADLRYPSEWFPATRCVHRKIHLHVGPTNSGKTYHALQRLEKARSGIYAGPLRLLAHEVFTRMNAKGKPCSLITGEERRYIKEVIPETGIETAAQVAAYTVEMIPVNKEVEVAVIDEIQMIGSSDRGWAWTQALLGVKAEEVHLCGEERTVPMVREICASLGEKLEIHRYERLSPLQMADESLQGNLKALKKGDCIVSFSVMGIHALRKQIERATGRKVATVYGSLPPETRAQQARLFNDPDNDYDFLVASDAVGMGLNLAIKRIIFESSSKFDGYRRRQLSVADVKQIAGRAGRYRVAGFQQTKGAWNQTYTKDAETTASEPLAAAKGEPAPSTSDDTATPPSVETTPDDTLGLVTSLEAFDFPYIRAAMTSEPEPIQSAGLFPPDSILERFASYFPPSTPFSYILTRLHELCQMHPRFHLCGLKDQVWIADMIEPVANLTITDRNIISMTPASKGDGDLWKKLMPAFARSVAEQRSVTVMDIPELPLEVLDLEVSATRDYLRSLELLHKGIVAFMWLSYRFAGIFGGKAVAWHAKSLVEAKIEETLGKFSFSEQQRLKLVRKREKTLLQDMVASATQERAIAENEEEEGEGRMLEEIVQGDSGQGETSLAFGGDRVGGEEEIPIEEPDETDVIIGADGEGQTLAPQESVINPEEEGVANGSGSTLAESGKGETHEGFSSASDAKAPSLSDSVLEAQDVVTSSSAISSKSAEIDIPTQDTLTTVEDLDDLLPSGASETPAQLREPEDRTPTDEVMAEQQRQFESEQPATRRERMPLSSSAPGSQSSTIPGSVPPKHLHAHLEANTKEVGADVGSRP